MSPFRPGQEVRVLCNGAWLAAAVHRVHSRGVDAIVGSRGGWYFPFEAVMEGQ